MTMSIEAERFACVVLTAWFFASLALSSAISYAWAKWKAAHR